MEPMGDGGGGSGLNNSLSTFGSALGQRMRQSISPTVKPAGNNPFDSLPSIANAKSHKFLGLFRDGGALRRPGDVAVVGDAGPELAVKKPGGETQVIPLERLMRERLGSGGAPQLSSSGSSVDPRASVSAPQTAPRASFEDLFRQRYEQSQTGGAATGAQTPNVPAPASPDPYSRFRNLTPDRGAPRPDNDPLTTPTPDAVRTPPGYVGQGIPSAAGESTTRERIHDPRAFYQKRLNEIETQPTHQNTNSRLKGTLKSIGYGALRGMAASPQNPLAGALGGAVTGGVVGAVDKTFDERMGENVLADRMRAKLADMNARKADDLKLQDAQAGVRLRNAQAGYAEQRPDLERDKLTATRATRVQKSLQTELSNRLKNPRPYDPSDTYDSDLAQRLEDAGMSFDPSALGDFKNKPTMEVIDPNDKTGTTKTKLEYDRATGQWSPVTVGGAGVQSSYVQPVGPDGMTAGTRGNLALGRDRFGETKRHDLAGETQGSERIGIMRGHLKLSEAAQNDRLDERDRRDAEKADKLAAQAERYQQAAEAIGSRTKYTDPNTGEEKESRKAQNQRDVFAAQAQALRRQLFSSYGDLYDRGPDGRVQMTTAQYRSMFPSLGGNFVGDAQSMGVQLTDADATGQGTPVPSPMHRPARRGARSAAPAPSEGKTHVTRADARKLYPQLKDASDTDVDAAIRSAGYEPIP
jgi:hypothetical protein